MLHLRPALIVQAGDESQELGAGELLIYERAIGNESELRLGRAGILDDIGSRYLDASAGWPENASDHPERRRLAGAVGSKEPEQFSARNGEVDRIDRGEGTVTLREGGEADH